MRPIWILVSALALTAAACAHKKEEPSAAAARKPFDPTACQAGTFSVYFEPWQAELSPEAKAQIKAAQDALVGCKIQHVRIVGLADAVGDKASNQKVSQARANTIATALETGGWSRAQFEVLAYGEKGAKKKGIEKPMRRRASVTVQASAP
jgi:outer membrane protein OmpA-like peptidoglycan-associated protein